MRKRDIWDDVPAAVLGCLILGMGVLVLIAMILAVVWLWKQVV